MWRCIILLLYSQSVSRRVEGRNRLRLDLFSSATTTGFKFIPLVKKNFDPLSRQFAAGQNRSIYFLCD